MPTFTSSTTWEAPTTGRVLFECYGGGGGGAGGVALSRGGAGGGGGAYASQHVEVIAGQVYTVTVGAGGSGGAHGGGDGTAGGVSKVSRSGVDHCVAAGGAGAVDTTPGAGGTVGASTGATRQPGAAGLANAAFNGGDGGDAGGPVGGAGGADPGQSAGVAGTVPGGGGSGGGQSGSGDGGAGGGGMVVVEYDAYVPTGGLVSIVESDPGSYSFTPDADGTVVVQCVGGGGGGKAGTALNGGGSGGGGGAYSESQVPVTKGTTYTLVVGDGGTGGTYSGGNGTNGGDSEFKEGSTVLVRAKGGLGCTSATTGAAGGAASSGIGDTKIDGFAGANRPTPSTNNGGAGGNAGGPIGGVGGAGGTTTVGPGGAGTEPGGGGGGGHISNNSHGGGGADGTVRVTYYKTHGLYVDEAGDQRHVVRFSQIASGARVPVSPSEFAQVISPEGEAAGTRRDVTRLKVDLSVTLKPVPAWCPVGSEALFNRRTGVFNWHAGTISNWAAALAGAGAAPAELGIIGDSLSDGSTYLNHLPPFNYTIDHLDAWPFGARDLLVDRLGIPLGGTGTVRPSLTTSSDPRYTFDGSTDNDGVHYTELKSGSGVLDFTSDYPGWPPISGTAVAVTYLDRAGAGPFTVSIDGGAPVTVTPTGSANSVKRYLVTGLADTPHEVRIADLSSSGTAMIVSVDVFRPDRGLRVHNLAQGGASVQDTKDGAEPGASQSAWSKTAQGLDSMLNVYGDVSDMFGGTLDAWLVLLGGNDLSGETLDAALYNAIDAGFETIGNLVGGASTDVIMVAQPHGSTTFAPAGYAVPMWERLYQTCLDEGWALIDMEWLTGGYEPLAALGYTGDVYGHPNEAGKAYIADLMARALATDPDWEA